MVNDRGASAAALGTMFTESFHDVLRQSLYPGQKIEVQPKITLRPKYPILMRPEARPPLAASQQANADTAPQ